MAIRKVYICPFEHAQVQPLSFLLPNIVHIRPGLGLIDLLHEPVQGNPPSLFLPLASFLPFWRVAPCRVHQMNIRAISALNKSNDHMR